MHCTAGYIGADQLTVTHKELQPDELRQHLQEAMKHHGEGIKTRDEAIAEL